MVCDKCNDVDRPHDIYSRTRNDRPVVQDDRIKINVTGETVQLTIDEVTSADAGTYELVAENALGSIDCNAKLTVHCMLRMKAP
jgi:hypothetical protein